MTRLRLDSIELVEEIIAPDLLLKILSRLLFSNSNRTLGVHRLKAGERLLAAFFLSQELNDCILIIVGVGDDGEIHYGRKGDYGTVETKSGGGVSGY